MKKIPLSQGKHAIVDDQDYGLIKKYKWWYHEGYARGWVNGKSILMHRFILNLSQDQRVDHIDRNGLDNRRSNMRVCTHAQNCKNRYYPNKTGYKGVCKKPGHNKWQANISTPKRRCLGVFDAPEKAALAYNKAAKEYFGKFAFLNNVSM